MEPSVLPLNRDSGSPVAEAAPAASMEPNNETGAASMEPHNETGERGEVKLKNVAIFGFAFATVLAFVAIKYDGIGADLFRNHKVTINCLQYFMMVAVCASTAVKLHQGLLPEWASLALSRVSIFCVFQAFFMLQAIVIFEETPRVWFVLCLFPVVFILIPLKQLKERGWFCRSPWESIKSAFEGFPNRVESPWRTFRRPFERLANLLFRGGEHPNQANSAV